MQAIIGNPEHPEYGTIQISFPISDDKYAECIDALEAMEIGGVTARDCGIIKISDEIPALNCLEGCCVNLDELNTLERLLSVHAVNGDFEKFAALAASRKESDITGLINLALCSEKATVITDFSKLEEAGEDHYLTINGGHAPSDRRDYYAIAEELIASGKGQVTTYGVLYDNGLEVEQIYKGGNLPPIGDSHRLVEAVLTPTVNPQDRDILDLFLPMPEKQLERALDRAGFETSGDYTVELEYMELPPEVNQIIKRNPISLYDVNKLCQIVMRMDGKQLETLAAAVLMAKPERVSEVIGLAKQLKEFEFLPGVSSEKEYGEYLIRESGQYNYDENLDPYYEYDKCGREQLESEQGAFTELGYVAYHGRLTLKELMMGNSVNDWESEKQQLPPRKHNKTRQRGVER